jgi:hypothetical protein
MIVSGNANKSKLHINSFKSCQDIRFLECFDFERAADRMPCFIIIRISERFEMFISRF